MTDAQGGAVLPKLRQVVLDTEDARGLAEFYRALLGLRYLTDDGLSTSDPQAITDDDWVVLVDANGTRVLAFQRVDSLPRPTWPEGPRPQMMHLDLHVPTPDALRQQHATALALGATVLEDDTDNPDEPIVIFADPAGHPFCVFVLEE